MENGFTLPESPGAIFVWVAVLAVIVGLYVLVSRTHRRSAETYLDRERRERQARDRDPDLRRPDGTDPASGGPGDPTGS